MKKPLLFLSLLLGLLLSVNAQVVFDPATYEQDSLDEGMSIVDIEGTSYLQVILNGWNSSIPLNPVVITKATNFKAMIKYSVGSSGYLLSGINTFFKLSSPDFATEIGALGSASSATFQEYSVNVANQGIIGHLQVAGQNTTNWGAVTGDTLWIGAVTVYPVPVLVEAVITRETFGTKAWDVDGPAKLIGHPTHWNYDEINTFSSTNGMIMGAYDSSVRINNYDTPATLPEYFIEPSGGMHAHMAIRTGNSYSGSWDTTYFSGIDISDANITSIEFGYGRIRTVVDGDTNHRSLNVEYRIDGDAWVQADTSIIINKNVFKKWDYIVMPTAIQGSSLDIRFSCLQTNEQIYLDDITVRGLVPAPEGTQEFTVENVVFGTVDNAADFTCNLNMNWDADSVYMVFAIADDSIVSTGASYQCDNLEIYFDLDNSKNVKYPRNAGWTANDPTFDANDYQFRLVPGVDYAVNNTGRPSITAGAVKQTYAVTESGYTISLNVALDTLMPGFDPTDGTMIGFDVLISDNDNSAAVNDANRNQITYNAPTANPYNDPSLFATLELKDGGGFMEYYDEENPTVPSNLATEVTDAKVKLTWDASSDNIAVLKYIVLQDNVEVSSPFGKETGNSYTANGLENGTYTFKVKAADNYANLSAASAGVDATVEVIIIDGLVENSKIYITVYPNPANSVLNIGNTSSVVSAEILSINGVVLSYVANNAANDMIIDTQSLNGGMYFIRLRTIDGTVIINKFSKQ